ncbi:DNA cytosine methyltransferase [Micromonospora aurantiaca]|uniref:DNA cytosine methyltransferase n=1 Tax=Micromonospora aurantiaca (nom. illeg.) TaxID=47850 RepID=UPI00344352D1
MNDFTYLSLFSGIGGLDLGLDRAGMRCVGQVERDEFCRRVLTKHWPEVPRHDDINTAVDWWRAATRPVVRLVAGGPPCQPVSIAGRKLAQDDERWLWEPMRDLIDHTHPEWVLVENVPGLRTRGLAIIIRDLRDRGYRVRAGVVRACEMGAPHPRARVFTLAHTDSARCGPRRRLGPPGPTAVRAGGWPTEPRVGRVAHGVPAGVDRRRALGNAVVPAVGEHIGRLILGSA